MRKIILSALFVWGGFYGGQWTLASDEYPLGFSSTISTGITISTNVPIILYRVDYSTGQSNGTQYFVVIDSNTLALNNSWGYSAIGVYGRGQWVTPAVVYSSPSATGAGNFAGNRSMSWGEQGVLIKNGLTLFQTDTGNHITFYWRKPRR